MSFHLCYPGFKMCGFGLKTTKICGFANWGLTIKNWEFTICGLAQLSNLRICDSGMIPRIWICDFKQIKLACPPLMSERRVKPPVLLFRSATPAWGGAPVEECQNSDY